MKSDRVRLSRRYELALREHLQQGSRASLQPAQRLGRQAVAGELETLDLARIHEHALVTLVAQGGPSIASDGMIRKAGSFFAEAITPIEETHRTAQEANVQLSQLNRSLRQRTVDLTASNRLLEREIARRIVVEEALKRSERQNSKSLDQSRQLQEQLRELSHQILSVQEEERKRISRELHDEVVQTLTSISLRLTNLNAEAKINANDLRQKIASTQRLVQRSVDIVHRFARELRPTVLDDLGLIPALHSSMKDFAKRTGLRIHFKSFTATRIPQLDNAQRTVFYRVSQEALTNVAKHAHASDVQVTVKKLPGAIRMEISDDGKGFDVDRVLFAKRRKRLGVLGMRERVQMLGGSFSIESEQGKGTTIRARIPVGRANAARRKGSLLQSAKTGL